MTSTVFLENSLFIEILPLLSCCKFLTLYPYVYIPDQTYLAVLKEEINQSEFLIELYNKENQQEILLFKLIVDTALSSLGLAFVVTLMVLGLQRDPKKGALEEFPLIDPLLEETAVLALLIESVKYFTGCSLFPLPDLLIQIFKKLYK